MPECERATEIQPFSQKIGEFVEWLRHEKGIVLARWEVLTEESPWTGRERKVEQLHPAPDPINRLLAEFFGIDIDKMEDEKRALLDALRRAHDADA